MGVDPVTHQRLPPDDVLGGAALAAAPGLPEALLSAAASLGGLNSVLIQAQALQLLLQAVGGGAAAAAGLMPSFSPAADNAMPPPMLNASSIVQNFQDQQMNLLAHANYRPADDYLSNLASFAVAEHDAVRQPNASSPAPAAALAPASSSFPQEVAAAADRRPVQGFSDLLSEAIEVPSMYSLEDEHFWKDMLAESNHLPL